MLTIGGFLARFTGTEARKDGPITTERVSDKTPLDPAEQKRQEWAAISRALDELVAQVPANVGE